MIQLTLESIRKTGRVGNFIAATTLNPGDDRGIRKWVLRVDEPDGWIFRAPPPMELGHSGYHDSALAATLHALESGYANTTVYSFQSEEEMDAWLNIIPNV